MEVQIGQLEQDIFELEQENEKLMMEYDAIFGQNSSLEKFKIPNDATRN